MRKYMCLFTVIILAVVSAAGAEDVIKKGDVLTLDQCISVALKKQPNIAAAMNSTYISQSKVGQAKANYYPQIDASTGYRKYLPLSTPAAKNSFDEYAVGITLKQNIYDFGKTSSQVNIQNLNLDSSQSELDNVKELIIFNVKQAYFEALKAKRNRDVALETVKKFEQHLDQAKGFFRVGTRPKFDVTKAEVDLSNAKLNLIKAANAVKISITNLNNAMGITDVPEYAVDDNLSAQKYDILFEHAIEQAYKNRPDLAAAVKKKKASEEAIALAKKGYYPAINGNAGYTQFGDKYPRDDAWTVGVTLSVPLFSGFSTKHQVEESRATLNVLKSTEESLRQKIYLDVQQSYLDIKEAEERIPTAELIVKQAEENLEIATGRYAAGVGSPIEVTDAEVALTNAKTAYNQALYDYKVAQARIERAMGSK